MKVGPFFVWDFENGPIALPNKVSPLLLIYVVKFTRYMIVAILGFDLATWLFDRNLFKLGL